MNLLIQYFAKQHTFVNILTFFVLVLGVISVLQVKREVFPSVSFDVVTVTTIFPNASADSVESLITNPLERKLKEVDGIKELTSMSIEGRSSIGVKLDPDQADVKEAEADIQDIVDAFKDLPEGAESPIVITLDSTKEPVIQLALSGNEDIATLRKIAKDLQRHIEKVPGVASVTFLGLPTYEMLVEVDPQKLVSYKLGINDIVNTLKRADINIPGGSIVLDGKSGGDKIAREFVIKTLSPVDSPDRIGNTVIKSNIAGTVIRIKDVAKTKLTFADQEQLYHGQRWTFHFAKYR